MKDLITWLLLWNTTWIFFILVIRPMLVKYDIIRYLFNGIYFLGVSLLLFRLFKFSGTYYFQLIIATVSTVTFGFILTKIKKYTVNLRKNGKYFLVFHPLNILFQQSMIFVAIYLLKNLTINYNNTYFAFFFLLLHAPMLLLKYVKYKYYYIGASFIGGYLFSFLINSFEYGLIYSFLLHYLAYVMLFYKIKNIEY